MYERGGSNKASNKYEKITEKESGRKIAVDRSVDYLRRIAVLLLSFFYVKRRVKK